MEIGSEFNLRIEELEESQNTIFEVLSKYNTYYLDSGRSAIRFLLKTISKGEVLLPEYICDSVINAFSGYDIKYYRLMDDLSIDLDDLYSRINDKTKAVFLMHYFGALQPAESLMQIKVMKKLSDFTIIEDTTHSIFSKDRTVGDYCLCSLRKWFSIPDGGVLYSTKPLENCNEYDLKRNTGIGKAYGMMMKTLFLDRKIESNLVYRNIFIDAEKKIDEKKEIERISSFSEYLLKCYDTIYLATKRKENYAQLLHDITAIGLSETVIIEEGWCPFVLPIKVDGRDDLREYLMENRVYCAVHWPLRNTPLYENVRSRRISERILSLPIDQRYGSKEIKYLAGVLRNYKEGKKCR